ncbi:MAG: hypothetical protein WAZ77_06520, partial [Candidatus Nitrosopolaris sp.]
QASIRNTGHGKIRNHFSRDRECGNGIGNSYRGIHPGLLLAMLPCTQYFEDITIINAHSRLKLRFRHISEEPRRLE